ITRRGGPKQIAGEFPSPPARGVGCRVCNGREHRCEGGEFCDNISTRAAKLGASREGAIALTCWRLRGWGDGVGRRGAEFCESQSSGRRPACNEPTRGGERARV